MQDLRKTHTMLKTGQEQEKTRVFFIYLSRFPDGFEQLSAEATLHIRAHTVKM